MRISKKHQERLTEIKDKIRESYNYFHDNITRYHEFVNFVFNTSLSQDEIDKLAVLQKPAIEFNILEAMISRLRGEFAKQEPSISVRAADGVPIDKLTPQFLKTMEVIEDHLREIFFDGDNDNLEYKIYSDLLAGGFSVVEVYTDYVHEFSFEQRIFVNRVFDPTLTGFEPLARASHKGDGSYCFQLIPKNKEEFEAEFGAELTKEMKFHRSGLSSGLEEFNWAYKNQDQDIVLVCDFYEKKKKRVKVCKLTNGHVMVKEDYRRFIELWDQQGILEQPPLVVSERWTEIEHIERYRLCGERILEHSVTNYKMLPLVFIDGNSIVLRKSDKSSSQQMTRPFVYHAKGIQQLKNFSGQTLAAEIENMVQHKFIAAAEAIPEDYQDAYTDVQQANVLVYNAFYKDNPDQPLPPPREIQRTPTPPIVEETFLGSDRVTQTILGSYDSLLGIQGHQISGVAIQQGALQSNAAALPYLVGYINGINRIAQIIVDLIPKYYVTPRSIPTRAPDGRRSYKVINSELTPPGEDVIFMGYDPNDLEIRVEAGPNASVQKQVAIDQITRMMQSSQVFAEFINTKGLETIIDNLDIRGADHMKAAALEFMQEQAQKAQAAAQQSNPALDLAQADIQSRAQGKQAELELKRQQLEADNQLKIAQLALEKQKANMDFLKIVSQIQMEKDRKRTEMIKQEDEDARATFYDAMEALKSSDETMHNPYKI